MVEWVSAECDGCGWKAERMMKSKAESGICPYCDKDKLRPA